MTTIAWDGKTLAADRRTSSDRILVGVKTKIAKRKKDGALVAAAGPSSVARAFLEWFQKGEKGPSPLLGKTEPSQAVIIRPNGDVESHDNEGWYPTGVQYYTNGSGWEIALGAMHAGATAKEAVEIASKLDGATGEGVDTLELGK